jgi:hypothetical protein
MNGEGRTMTRNYETICDPPPWAMAVPGYSFRRDQNGRTIARCVRCSAGFAVTEHNAAPVRYAMVMHREWVHGCGW